jgi:predicted NAD/FAD-binding protein
MGINIAVVGGGIAGLTVACRLCSEHQVTLFEANDYIGGHTNTVQVELDGERHAIDTGFIVFNERTYPNFIRLLTELGVASKPTQMSFSVLDERSGLEYNGHSLNSLFAQRRNLLRPVFYRMIADILRFNRVAMELSESDALSEMTVSEFLQRHKYGEGFVQHYLLPLGAAIWSCPPGKFADFPVQFIIDFFRNHGLLQIWGRPQWRVIEGGSHTYVNEMLRRFVGRLRLRTPVVGVRRFTDHVEIASDGEACESFDRVVFACHSNQALRILGNEATHTERALLSQFPYQENTAILHTDESVLPRNRLAWASWNYRVSDRKDVAAAVTYNMNILQGIVSRHTFCVTLNDEGLIVPERILSRFNYQHPVFTTARNWAQARHGELLSANRTSFCGAYWGNGFHEDGVNSALAVVSALKGSTREESGYSSATYGGSRP